MIYINQPLRIRLKASANVLSDYSVLQIKYIKPDDDGTEGEWTASIYPSDNRYIYYDVPANVLNVAGSWKVKTKITYNSGNTYEGKTVSFKVENEWE